MVLRPLGNALPAGRSTGLRYVCQALVQSGPLPRAPRGGGGPRAAWWRGRRQAGTCVGALRRSYFYPPLGSCPTPPPPTERHPRACREDPGDALSAHRLATESRGSCGVVLPASALKAQPDRGPQPEWRGRWDCERAGVSRAGPVEVTIMPPGSAVAGRVAWVLGTSPRMTAPWRGANARHPRRSCTRSRHLPSPLRGFVGDGVSRHIAPVARFEPRRP